MRTHHTGSCLCGNVRYTVEGAFERFYLCHCSHCRKDSGSAHAANLFSSVATLTWLCGQASVTSFRLPGTRHARNFCAACGSALPLASDGMVVVPAGSLDTDIDVAPDGNIFTASRAAWDHDLHMAPSHDSFPA
ncbi:GFA family protein [Rhodanobacter lindaniclasticus]